MNKYRTHNCAELNDKDINNKVHLSGWLHRKRDHGNLLFFDLRDHFGLTQCVTENSASFFKEIEVIGLINVIKIMPSKIDIIPGIKITDRFDMPDTFIAVISSFFLILRKNQIPDIKTIKGSILCNKDGTFSDVNNTGR